MTVQPIGADPVTGALTGKVETWLNNTIVAAIADDENVEQAVDDAIAAADIPGQVSTLLASTIVKGSGPPNGAVTADPGTLYVDTAKTLGAQIWRKDTGTGNTGWVVVEGDTGWRDVKSFLANGWTAALFMVRRVNHVTFVGFSSLSGAGASSNEVTGALPTGIRYEAPAGVSLAVSLRASTGSEPMQGSFVNAAGRFYFVAPESSHANLSLINYRPATAWPASLPGIPV